MSDRDMDPTHWQIYTSFCKQVLQRNISVEFFANGWHRLKRFKMAAIKNVWTAILPWKDYYFWKSHKWRKTKYSKRRLAIFLKKTILGYCLAHQIKEVIQTYMCSENQVVYPNRLTKWIGILHDAVWNQRAILQKFAIHSSGYFRNGGHKTTIL